MYMYTHVSRFQGKESSGTTEVVCLWTCIHTYPKMHVDVHVRTWCGCIFRGRERRKPEGVCMYTHICNNACGYVYTYLVWQYDRRKGNVGQRKGCVYICIHTYTKIHVDVYVGTWCGSIFGGKGTSETARGVYAYVNTRMQISIWMCINVPGMMVDSEERERWKTEVVCTILLTSCTAFTDLSNDFERPALSLYMYVCIRVCVRYMYACIRVCVRVS